VGEIHKPLVRKPKEIKPDYEEAIRIGNGAALREMNPRDEVSEPVRRNKKPLFWNGISKTPVIETIWEQSKEDTQCHLPDITFSR